MPRPRKKDTGLPPRVYTQGFMYVFQPKNPTIDPKDGVRKTKITLTRITLGREAMREAYDKLVAPARDKRSVPSVCERYVDEGRLDEFKEETQKTYRRYLTKIADAFEDFQMSQIETVDWSEFIDANYGAQDAENEAEPGEKVGARANTANKITALMRKVFKFAISKGLCPPNDPLQHFDAYDYKTETRTVLATPEQIKAIRMAGLYGVDGRNTASGRTFIAMIDMAYLIAQRAIDVREMREDQIEAGKDGAPGVIHVTPSKTSKTSGKSIDIVITPAIAKVIERARAVKRARSIISPWLFPSRTGEPYKQQSLNTMWDRAKERAGLKDVDVTFRDLRSMSATYAKRGGATIEQLQTRLAHTSAKTTQIYIKEPLPDLSDMETSLPW